MSDSEIWIDVVNTNREYQVSSLGRVKSLKFRKHKILCPTIHKGYFNISINSKTFQLHRLVGLHFIPNPVNNPQINHKNGVTWDNRVENLEWGHPIRKSKTQSTN